MQPLVLHKKNGESKIITQDDFREKEECDAMKKKVAFTIDEKLYTSFEQARLLREETLLRKETDDEAVEEAIRLYITQAVKKQKKKKTSKDFYGMANRRIPKWAMSPNQYNHKIVRAYFMAEDIAGEDNVTLEHMEALCSDKSRTDLYVPTFKSNYNQMTFDGPASHGKVFEDDGYNVWIWEEIEETLMKYKSMFYVIGE